MGALNETQGIFSRYSLLAYPSPVPQPVSCRHVSALPPPGLAKEGSVSWKLLLVIIGALMLGAYYLGPQFRPLLPAWLR